MEVQLLDKIRWANLVSSLPLDNLFRNNSFRGYLAKASSMIPLYNNSTNRRQLKAADLGSQITSRIMPMEVSKFLFRIHKSNEVSFNQKTAPKATTRVKSLSEAWMMESSNNNRIQWWKQVRVLILASGTSKAHRQFRESMTRMKSHLMMTTCMKNRQIWECIPNSSKIYLEFKPLIPWGIESKLWGSILNSSSVIRHSLLLISTWTTSKKTMMIKQIMSLREFLVAERWNSYRWSFT
jgi:hypothetical protein